MTMKKLTIFKNPFFLDNVKEFQQQFADDIMAAVLSAYKEVWAEKKRMPKDMEVIERVYLVDIHELTHIIASYHLQNGREKEYERLKLMGPEMEDLNYFYTDMIDVRGAMDHMKMAYYVDLPIFGVTEIRNPVRPGFFEED